jgi:hypothetical protein
MPFTDGHSRAIGRDLGEAHIRQDQESPRVRRCSELVAEERGLSV